MKKIVMFDTASGSLNVGDYIINESINRELSEFLENNFVVRFSTHTPIAKFLQNFRNNYISNYCKLADYKFLCGTNLFSMNLLHFTPNFNVNIFDIKNYKNSIAVGCGIGDVESKINFYTKKIYKSILSEKYIHSVRDENTKKFLNSLGLKAINTGCATMWSLTKEHCKKIPITKAENVIFTLTDYKKDENADSELIRILKKNYKKVYFWVQGSNDLEYFNSLPNTKNIHIINPNLNSYKNILQTGNVDYVGTRLHAGIYAMQNYVRTIILIVDNRAKDIKDTYNVPTIERKKIKLELEKMINNEIITDININEKNINQWKNQFIK